MVTSPVSAAERLSVASVAAAVEADLLELLQQARLQLNDLTRRHLEYYYREALRLTSRAGTPDRAHVLVKLSDDQDQFLLPAGTLLQAGEDSQGNDLYYRSDEDLLHQSLNVVTDEDPDYVAVFSSDHIYKMDVRQFVDFHIESGAANHRASCGPERPAIRPSASVGSMP